MKKRLLFIAPGYYGFNEVVFEGLKKYSGYDVTHINSTLPYQYKNIFEKIYNFVLKTFLGKNLKNIKSAAHIQNTINILDYDVLLVNRPDVLSLNDLDLAIKKSKHSIALFWDSIQKYLLRKSISTNLTYAAVLILMTVKNITFSTSPIFILLKIRIPRQHMISAIWQHMIRGYRKLFHFLNILVKTAYLQRVGFSLTSQRLLQKSCLKK